VEREIERDKNPKVALAAVVKRVTHVLGSLFSLHHIDDFNQLAKLLSEFMYRCVNRSAIGGLQSDLEIPRSKALKEHRD
jgi:hypothetical protein